MDQKESQNVFKQFWKWTKSHCLSGDKIGQQNSARVSMESRISDIEKAERARRAALCENAEGLCATQQARNDAVLARLGLSVQDATQPLPHPPAAPRENKFFGRRQRTGRLLEKLDVENIKRNQRSPEGLKRQEQDLFWRQVNLGSQMVVLNCDMAKLADDRGRNPTASISCGSSLSSVDTHTPTELRNIPLIGSPVELSTVSPAPPPPRPLPPPRRRASRLPLYAGKATGADKEVVDGIRLQTVLPKVTAVMERIECYQQSPVRAPQPSVAAKRTLPGKAFLPEPPVAAKKTLPRKPLAPKPPGAAKETEVRRPLAPKPPAGPPPKRTGPRPGRVLKPVKGAGKKTANGKKERVIVEHKPLARPGESLSLCFTLLSSDDWKKKIDGLKIIQALAQHHSTTLKTKLHEVCLVLAEEVHNLRSVVACAAINTLDEMYVHLQKALDPDVEITGRSLLLKLAQTTNEFVHQQVNLALDSMVTNCSHSRTVTALLNTGLNHRCIAVRGSTAEHLHQVADIVGVDYIFTAGKSFTERFLTAVSKMSVDAAPEVRHHALTVLQELALHSDFLNLWTKIIPEKERRPLDKILKNSYR